MKFINLSSAKGIRACLQSLSQEAVATNLRTAAHLIDAAIEDLDDVLRHCIHVDATADTVKEHINGHLSEEPTRR